MCYTGTHRNPISLPESKETPDWRNDLSPPFRLRYRYESLFLYTRCVYQDPRGGRRNGDTYCHVSWREWTRFSQVWDQWMSLRLHQINLFGTYCQTSSTLFIDIPSFFVYHTRSELLNGVPIPVCWREGPLKDWSSGRLYSSGIFKGLDVTSPTKIMDGCKDLIWTVSTKRSSPFLNPTVGLRSYSGRIPTTVGRRPDVDTDIPFM